MLIKWIGALLIVAGCGFFGFYMGWNVNRDASLLRALVAFIDGLSSELSYRMSPLPDALRATAQLQKSKISAVFVALAEQLEQQISPNVGSCMEHVLSQQRHLPANTLRQLHELGGLLGTYDMQGQQSGLAMAKETCMRILSQLDQDRTQRVRGYQTLGLCAGAALAILFI